VPEASWDAARHNPYCSDEDHPSAQLPRLSRRPGPSITRTFPALYASKGQQQAWYSVL